jgi:hypothetical protein
MTDCNAQPLLFSSLGSKKIQADFNGGSINVKQGKIGDMGNLLLFGKLPVFAGVVCRLHIW